MQIRKTCTKPLKHKVFTCALPLGFGPGGSEHKCSTVHKTCGLRECVEPSGEHPGLDCGLRGMAYGWAPPPRWRTQACNCVGAGCRPLSRPEFGIANTPALSAAAALPPSNDAAASAWRSGGPS